VKKTTYILAACILLLVGSFAYYFMKDEPLPPPTPTKAAQSDTKANITFAGSSIVEEEQGKRLWELNAENIEVDPNTKIVHLRNLKGTFYQPNGQKLELIAQEGTLDTTTRDVVVVGEAKAINSDGAVLTAQQFRYAGQDRRLFGTGGVTLTREDTVLTGDSLESTSNLDKFKIQGNARIRKGGVTP
jgi:LPS export ABC transporter protein LptC